MSATGMTVAQFMGCYRKQGYKTPMKALKVLKNRKQHGRVYLCSHCDLFHLTKKLNPDTKEN